jgi:serine/threonine-protein kinase
MEYVAGPTLFEVHCAGPLGPHEVVRIVGELAAGLAAAHDRGVLHLDVKIENVLLGADGQPKLTDFGIAHCMHEVDLELDPASQLIGTPRAMSPEQIQGDPVDERSDLYSLGVLAFELLAGTSPFAAGSELQTLSRVLRECAPRVDTFAPTVPAELSQLVGDLLEKSPANRPRSAREVEVRLIAIAEALA